LGNGGDWLDKQIPALQKLAEWLNQHADWWGGNVRVEQLLQKIADNGGRTQTVKLQMSWAEFYEVITRRNLEQDVLATLR